MTYSTIERNSFFGVKINLFMGTILSLINNDNQLVFADNSLAAPAGCMTIEEIYELFRQHLSSLEGIEWNSVEGFKASMEWDNTRLKTKTRTIYRKARNAQKYMEFLVAYNQSINSASLKSFKGGITKLFEQGKITRRSKNSRCVGLNPFLKFCEKHNIRKCRKGVERDKFNIKGDPILLEFGQWIKNRSKVEHETDTAYLSVNRINKFFEFLKEMELINDNVGFGPHLLRLFLKNHNVKTGTKNNYINSIRLFMRFMLEKKYLPDHMEKGAEEIAKFEKLEEDDEEVARIGLTEAEREILLKSSTDVKDHVIIGLAAYQGLRVFSMVRLKYSDINLIAKTINIHNKGRNGTVERPLSKVCYDALVTYMSELDNKDDRQRLLGFTSEGGLYTRIINILDKAGLREVERFGKTYTLAAHSLRHTFAQLLLNKTNDINLVSKMLCHKNITTTMVYLKSRDKEKMDSVFADEFSVPEN